MTRTYSFTTSNAMIGFDSILDRFNDAQRSNTGNYPPYNIIKNDDTHWSIELAVAGFTREELDVELAEGVLTVCGKLKEEKEVEYAYRGLAKRAFTRKWTLAEDVLVNEVSLKDGLLFIELERVIPEDKKPRKFEIL